MSAAILREAAALMRERAEDVAKPAPSPWTAHDAAYGDPSNGPDHIRVSDAKGGQIAELPYEQFGGIASQHIASWHPAVALAVADWLDEAADFLAAYQGETHAMDNPLNVARTYLGRTS